LRELAMPFDNLAANQYTGPLDFRSRFCGGELCHLPYNSRLDFGGVRSQCYRFCLDWNTHVPGADSLRLLPCEQQLLAQFGGLLRVPPAGFYEHHDHWRSGAESRHGRFPDDGISVRYLPPHNYLGGGSFQSQHDRLPAHECACHRGLQSVPHQ